MAERTVFCPCFSFISFRAGLLTALFVSGSEAEEPAVWGPKTPPAEGFLTSGGGGTVALVPDAEVSCDVPKLTTTFRPAP